MKARNGQGSRAPRAPPERGFVAGNPADVTAAKPAAAPPSNSVKATFAENSSQADVLNELRLCLPEDRVAALVDRWGRGVDTRGFCFLNFDNVQQAEEAMRLLQERAFFKAITFQHTFASPTPTCAKFRRQSDAAGASAARPGEADLRALERLALDGRVCDVARLPAAVAAQVLDRAVPLAVLCGVALEALSDRGIQLQGTPDALCEARRTLCAMVKEELGAALSVHRLVTESCRLLATSPAEQARAQQLWQGRRVLHKATGELLFVRELRVFPGPAPRIELTCGRIELTCGALPGDAATAPVAEEGARADDGGAEVDHEVLLSGEEAVSWDDFGTPDSVKLWVPALGSDDLVAAFARRACTPIAPIEAVEVVPAVLPSKSGAPPSGCYVTVVFDVTSDALAPARAVAQLHGLVVGAAKFHLSAAVALPARPVRLVVGAPKVLRLRGRFEAEMVTASFPPGHVAKVVVPAAAAAPGVTTVHFVSAAATLSARRALPAAFAAPGVATLDLKPTGRLVCKDVPLAVKPDVLLAQLLPLAQPPPAAEESPHEEEIAGGVCGVGIGVGGRVGVGVGGGVVGTGSGPAISTLPCGPGTKTLVFAFPHLSPVPALIAKAAPFFTLQGEESKAADSSTRRTRAQLTTLALMRLLESESIVERILKSDSEDESDTSSGASSALAPTISRAEGLARLGALAANFEGPFADPRELYEELDLIIAGLFPHPAPRGVCTRHSAFELGAVPLPCCYGMACTYGHGLRACRQGAGCSKPNCSFVHPAQLMDVLRLDTRLHEHYKAANAGGSGGVPAAPALSSLMVALQAHRAAMMRDGDVLVVQHTKRAETFEVQVAAEQAREPQNGAEAAEKASSVEALQQRAREVRKQIGEFALARAAFMEADPESFAAARVFAREVYNRFTTCLPIYAERATILAAVRPDFCALVLSAETGSGKSTQVVQYLAENVLGRVLCSQPRRLAADKLADRVAAEMMTTKPTRDGSAQLVSCKGGGGGGGGARANERRTRIQICTDFGLLNALYKDPTLAGVGAVVVDEVHERSVATDLLVALLRRTLALRMAAGKQPFRLILTSATMNEALFANYFARKQWDAASPEDGTCAPVLKVGGRTFPVAVHYEAAASVPGQHERAATAKALELHVRLPASNYDMRAMHDILVFQTAPDECERVAKALAERLPDALCVPLHGGLDKDEQDVAVEPVDTARYKRKIVVATNIAEASITIDGIGAVIDTGVSKQACYDPAKDATVLRVAAVSQASARQRAGRAGRTAPGVCFRLYSREEFEDFDQDSTAELLRADATEAVLAVLRQLERQTDWIADVRDFPFVEHPGEARLERALQQLLHLGALASAERGSSSKLTPQGSRMARMQCSPRTAAILFSAQRLGAVVPVAVALGSVPTTVSLFLRGRTEEEKTTADRARAELGARFPELGDIGVGVAVWLETRDLSGPDAMTWCKGRGVSVRAVRECGKQIRQLLSDAAALQPDSASAPNQAGHRRPPGADEDEQELQAALRMSMEPTAPSVGARVKLHSLQQKPEHNGVEGEVLEFDASEGRWKVQLHPDGLVLALKASNLVVVAPEELMCGADVEIHSLVRSPELNGVRGKVVEPQDPGSGLWGVKIDSDGRVLALEPANLVLIRKHTPRPGPELKCAVPVQFNAEEVAPTMAALAALTPAAFEGAALVKLRAALLAGYFSSLAFALPRRPGDGEDVPVSYFLPHSAQIAQPGKGSACRSTRVYPHVVAYMEVRDTHRVFLSNCFGVGDADALADQLPPSYSASPAFAAITAANNQLQAMAEFSAVSTPCTAALKRLLGPGSSRLDALREAAREAAGVTEDAALVLEADVFKNQLLVACSQPGGRQCVAAYLQAEVDLVARRLAQRRREWALPGTGVRGVMGSGAACSEVLLRPKQSICLRFVALDITHRLSEPIVAINLVPAGFFRSLADPDVDLAALKPSLGLASPSPYTGIAQHAVSSIHDLRAVPLPAVVAAIEYTAGGAACYVVNSLLRALNEEKLRAYEPHIRALNGFHRLRSEHPCNARRPETLLYRGTTIPSDVLAANYKPGCTVVWPAFTSTSTSVHVAEAFAGGKGPDSVLFEIISPFYCPLMDISVYPGEDEVLLPAFCCFQVVAVLPWGWGSSRKVILRHDPSLATVEPPPPEQAVELDEMERMRATGTGPLVLKPVSTKKGVAGVAEDVETQMRGFDADADVEVRTDAVTGRVWGRAWFGSSAQAAQAMKILNGSQLGTRELQVQLAPCDTDLLQVHCRVFATLTAVPHTGAFFCSCGTRLADEIMAKAQENAFFDKKAGKMRAQLHLSLEPNAPPAKVGVELQLEGKDGPPVPGSLRLLRVPSTVTLSRLHAGLLSLFPQLPISALSPPAREGGACDREAKALRRLGPKGTRERLAFVTSLASGSEVAEETGIKFGATFTLWFASPEAARAAARALDGCVMPNTGLRAQAVVEESFTAVLFQPDVLGVVEADLDATVARIRAAAEAGGGLTIKLRTLDSAKKKGVGGDKGVGEGDTAKGRRLSALRVTVSGSDCAAVASAQRELEALQRGVLIPITSPVPQARAAQRAAGQDFPQPAVRASQGRCGSGRFAAYRGGAQVPGKAPICRQCSPRRRAGWRRGCRGDQGGSLPRRDALRSQTPRPR